MKLEFKKIPDLEFPDSAKAVWSAPGVTITARLIGVSVVVDFQSASRGEVADLMAAIGDGTGKAWEMYKSLKDAAIKKPPLVLS